MWIKNKKFSSAEDLLVEAIDAWTIEELALRLDCSSTTVRRALRKVWPDLEKSTAPIGARLLRLTKLKKCYLCKELLAKAEFSKNSYTKDKLQQECKHCQSLLNSFRDREKTKLYRKNHLKEHRAYQAKRRLLIKNQTPKWQKQEELLNFYKNCPEGYEVDHIIPINNKKVCGLHCIDNLQYLTSTENRIKGNKLVETVLPRTNKSYGYMPGSATQQ